MTFVHKKNDKVKFALDLKTTFRRNKTTAGFTLGSHGGYFKERDKDKNIQFPYNQYNGHYCLGIIYTRSDFDSDLAETEIFQVSDLSEKQGKIKDPIKERQVTKIDNLKSITSVIKDFDFLLPQNGKLQVTARDQEILQTSAPSKTLMI